MDKFAARDIGVSVGWNKTPIEGLIMTWIFKVMWDETKCSKGFSYNMGIYIYYFRDIFIRFSMLFLQ